MQLQLYRTKESLDEEIRSMRPFLVACRPGLTFEVTVKMFETMIDGKVLNILTGTASNTCGLCGATPTQLRQTAVYMNTRQFIPRPRFCKLGLGPLHGKIKLFGQLYKVACNKPIFDNKERNREAARILRADRKQEIQDAFLAHGFRVDMPNQYGTGNTLNGPLCSELFQREELLAEVLGLDSELIHCFR